MALVQVPDGRRWPERAQRADAADAEDDLLLDARLAVAAVQARRERAIPRGVLFEIGVEQVQLDAAQPDAPHGHEHRAVAERDGGDARLAVGGRRRLDGDVAPSSAFRSPLPASRRR